MTDPDQAASSDEDGTPQSTASGHAAVSPTSLLAVDAGGSAPTAGAAGMARDAGWNYAALAVTLASGVLIMALGFRELPPRLIGVYAIATATTSLLAVIDPAIGMGVSRSVARLRAGRAHPDERSLVDAGHAMLAAIGTAVLVVAPLLGVAGHLTGLFDLPAAAWVMLVLVALSFGLQLATAALPAVLTGYTDFFGQAVAAAVLAGVSLLVVVVALPTLGVAALGAAQLAAVILSRAYLWQRVRRTAPWFSVRPRRPTRAGVRALSAFSIPMLLLVTSAQVIAWTDVVVIGGLAGAAAAALYRVGMLAPTQLVALLYRAYDVAYPRLSAGDAAWQRAATGLLTRVFGAMAAVCLAGLIVLRRDVVLVLTGQDEALPQLVLVIFALAWAVNVPAHGLALLAIARGRQAAFTPLVICEAVFNIVLTLLLVALLGAAGAAWATLVTIAASNLLVLPLVLRRDVERTFQLVYVEGLAPMVVAGGGTFILLNYSVATVEGERRVLLAMLIVAALTGIAALVFAGRAGRGIIYSSLRSGRASHDVGVRSGTADALRGGQVRSHGKRASRRDAGAQNGGASVDASVRGAVPRNEETRDRQP